MIYEFDRFHIRYMEREGVYPVREDTLLLMDAVLPFLEGGKGRFLDMGCGTSLLSLIGSKLGWEVTSIDREPGALSLLRSNLALNSLDSRPFLSDLFDGLPWSNRDYDLIAFNPPYLSDLGGGREEVPLAGGVRGFEIAARFLVGASDRISSSGRILMINALEWGVSWDREIVNALYEVEDIARRDPPGEDLSVRCYFRSDR
ncbi:MAG: methyltransferase [Thermoplasmata archaeon]|nr:methyltransferase [Thermoplasmata archaeon]